MYKKMTHEQMSVAERVARVVLGAAMIAPLYSPEVSTAGWLAVLALAAAYPVLTGLAGADPVRGLLKHPLAYRVFAATVGAGLIGVAFAVPAIAPSMTLGSLMILPLAGIYAVLAAMLGHAPLAAVTEAMRTIVYIVPPKQAAENVAENPAMQGRIRTAA